MLLEIFMNTGTLLSTAASVPKMVAVLRNRDRLAGFSVSGIIMKMAAILAFTASQAILGIWLSVAFNMLLLAYNAVKLYYVWKCRSGKSPIDGFIKRKFQRLTHGP